MSFLIRAIASDLSVEGRTIVGLAVPFERVSTVCDGPGQRPYKEAFRRGAFMRTIAERGDRVKAHVEHQDQRLPIGRAVHLEERANGLETHLRVSATSDGNDVLALVRDGVLSGLSIGFRPIRHSDEGGVKYRTEVALNEISVVDRPAYPDAQIESLRSILGTPTSRLDIARRRLQLLELEQY